MKKLKTLLLSAALVMGFTGAGAQSLGDILGNLGNNSSTGGILGSVIEGVFTKSDLSIEDLVGNYVSTGPAVTFKSEDFLQKAGGIAAAATIESKLSPYYEQYGLTGMTLEVDQDANFSMKVKGVKLSGVITKNDGDGTFNFNLSVLGMQIGKFVAYVEKSGSNLKVMFDATKLKQIISSVAKFTGNSMASAMADILDSYEGACIGFKMQNTSSSSSSSDGSAASSSGSSSSGLDALKDILNKNK